MLDILQFPFMQRALLVGVLLAALLALLGVFVMLRRMSFFADGIAHASLAGVALGIIFSLSPLAVALALTTVFAVIIWRLEHSEILAADTVIGIIFTSGMALGVLLLALQPGYQPELMSFLFGNILAIQSSDALLVLMVGVAVALFIAIHFRGLILFALDRDTARVAGVKTNYLHGALYILLALSVVLGVKVLGIILVSGLLIIPIASAKLLARSLRQLVYMGIALSEIMVLTGITLSYYADVPTGPTIVLTGTALFSAVALMRLALRRHTNTA